MTKIKSSIILILLTSFSCCQISAQSRSTSQSQNNSSISTLQSSALRLVDTEKRYDLVGMDEASRFFKSPAGASVEDFFQYGKSKAALIDTADKPSFRGGATYWFSIDVYNDTEQEDWQLHISNFFIKRIDVLIEGNASTKRYHSDFAQGIGQVATNPIGRSFALALPRGQKYTLVLQISADNDIWTPYIGLMAKPYYDHWSNIMDYIYRTAIGIILGIILCTLIAFFLLIDITYLWFSLSSGLLLLFYLLRGSVNIEFLDNSYGFSQPLWLLVSLTIITLLLFAYSFLKIEKKASPFFYYIYIAGIGISFFSMFLSFLFSDEINIRLYSLNATLMVTIIFCSGMAKVFHGEKYYILFMVGWLPILVSLTEYIKFIIVDDQISQPVQPSYKVIREMFVQIAHMSIHLIAMIIRLRELEGEKLKAELANEAKTQFFASASHDLRQPLHAMGMFISSLKPHISSPTGIKLLHSLELSQGSMNRTFLSLMDISRLDAGVVQAHRENFALTPLFTQLEVEYTKQAAAKNILLRVVDTTLWVDSDPLLLERILRNLIANAIHYTSRGKVLFGCRRKSNSISIEVWDTGQGIAEETLLVIFEPYERGSNAANIPDGMGLGLSIVRRTADLLNHKLSVRSKLGQGTVFSLELPRVFPSGTYVPVQVSSTVDNPVVELNVALVDDDLEICEAMNSLLTQWGCEVHTATSLPELIATMEDEKFQPDLLISDLNLSNQVSGLEVFERIEDMVGRNIVTVLITADTSSEELELAQQRGILVLLKPVNPAQLRALLSYVRSHRFADEVTTGTGLGL